MKKANSKSKQAAMFQVVQKWVAMETKAVKGALETFGKEAQINMAMEEMAELIQALSKNLRGVDNVDNIAEEIADVSIMLEQMIVLFNCSDRVNHWHKNKICRLAARVKKAKEGKKHAT